MQEYSMNAIQFATGVSYEEFVKDRICYFAIVKNVEIIGEAANMLTNDFRKQHTELPWVGFNYQFTIERQSLKPSGCRLGL